MFYFFSFPINLIQNLIHEIGFTGYCENVRYEYFVNMPITKLYSLLRYVRADEMYVNVILGGVLVNVTIILKAGFFHSGIDNFTSVKI